MRRPSVASQLWCARYVKQSGKQHQTTIAGSSSAEREAVARHGDSPRGRLPLILIGGLGRSTRSARHVMAELFPG